MSTLGDYNVPFNAKGFSNQVGEDPTMHVQIMAVASTMAGASPAISPAAHTNPAISADLVKWTGLTSGGLFDFGQPGRALWISETYVKGGGTTTYTLIRASGSSITMPSVPFRLEAGETISVSQTVAGGEVGISAHLYGYKRV